MNKEKIVLAYSGGLDTSVAIKWLQEKYGYEVIALCADVGEGKDLDFIQQKALSVGASQCHVIDLQEEFANDYVLSALQANALYQGVYPLISALSRPLISKHLVKIAHDVGATAIAHGCTGKGNDQVRFDVSIKTLDPNLKIVAPVRESPMAREDAIAYAKAHDIPLPITLDNPFSIDLNLWGRSCECGVLEDPWAEPPEEAFAWTAPVAKTPGTAQDITIEFEQGVPVALDGKRMAILPIIKILNEQAGEHGIGRIDHIEDRLVGIKSREIYEAPAAMTLITAHRAIESLCLTRDVIDCKHHLEQQYAKLVYEGLWYSPLKTALDAFMHETQRTVTGTVKLRFFKGQATVIGRQSQLSLYQMHLATYNPDDAYDHEAAKGFITIWGLPLQVHAMVNGQNTTPGKE